MFFTALTLLAQLVALAVPVLASELFVVRDVRVEGLTRTSEDIVIRETGLATGDRVSRADIDESVRLLRNTGLFSRVDIRKEESAAGVSVIYVVEERWTTIPILKLSSGGGVTQAVAGVYDPNILGRYIEAGGQYERLGATNSGVLWFRDPNVLGAGLSLSLQAWRINRLRTKYRTDQLDPVEKLGFLHSRARYVAEAEKTLHPWLRAGVLLETHDDRFSDRYVDEEIRARTEAAGGLPPDTRTNFYGLGLKLGRLDYDAHHVSGQALDVQYRHGMALTEGQVNFDEYTLNLTAARTVLGDWTLAQRVMSGVTSTRTLQYWYYFGGLDRIRGFADNRFAGRCYWLSNSEVRIPTLHRDWLVVQAVGFYDALSVGEEFGELNRASGAAVGGGLRFIAPRIYRLVARLDFAVPVVKRDNMPVSFGVQQFF